MRDELVTDGAIAALAGAQGGVVSRAQLLALGLGPAAIGRRTEARLHPLHRGVYAVGHRAVGIEGRRWAAVLALGPGAALSHGSAAAAWDLRHTDAGVLHVTVGPGGRARRRGLRIHRSRLPADEITTLRGLRITTPARTLLDLARAGLRGRPLEAALDRAERRTRMDWADLRRLLERYPRRPGSSPLAATLARYVPGSVRTRSILEEIVLELCDHHSIPRPEVNRIVEGEERDFYWPHRRLVVEADSYGWHRSPSALNDDRERDVHLTLAGFVTLRFTYEQCTARRRYVKESILRGLRDDFLSLSETNSSRVVARSPRRPAPGARP